MFRASFHLQVGGGQYETLLAIWRQALHQRTFKGHQIFFTDFFRMATKFATHFFFVPFFNVSCTFLIQA